MHPLWMRWVAAACLLLVSVASTAQAVHVHGQWRSYGKAQVHAPAGAPQTALDEGHCPLCVAMHSALPATVATTPRHAALYAVLLPEFGTAAPQMRWPFAMFSRPPPAPRA